MKTLVIYDNKGTIFYAVTGDYVIPDGGIQYIEVEVPQDKRIVSVDVTDNNNPMPIFEDIPKSETEERLSALEEENTSLSTTLDDILTNIIPSITVNDSNK